MQDIEEDPELRGQIDLYKNEDVIRELEKKMAGIDLDKQSTVATTLEKGKGKVAGEERRVAKGARKTEQGRQKQAESEETRKKEEALIKATLKQGGDDSDGDGSVEGDYPHVKLDELKDLEDQLADMKIEADEDEFEDMDEEEEAKQAPAKKKK